VSLPVTDGRFRLLDDVHDPATQLRVEVQVVDVRPEEVKVLIILRILSMPGNERGFNIVSASLEVFVLLSSK
jgi:hypothetical protein